MNLKNDIIINGDNARLKISGSEDKIYNDLNYKRFRIAVSGSGDITLNGNVEELEIALSGSSTLDARDLHAESVTIDASGSGKIYACASRDFHIESSGSGKIYLYGSGRIVEKEISGSTKIIQKTSHEKGNLL